MSGNAAAMEFTAFVSWTLIVIGVIVALVIGSALWATRRGDNRLRVRDVVICCWWRWSSVWGWSSLKRLTQQPKVSAEAVDAAVSPSIANLPIIAAWVVAIVGIVAVVYLRVAGWWRKLYRFPEFDVLIVMGTLILALADGLRHQGDGC